MLALLRLRQANTDAASASEDLLADQPDSFADPETVAKQSNANNRLVAVYVAAMRWHRRGSCAGKVRQHLLSVAAIYESAQRAAWVRCQLSVRIVFPSGVAAH